MSSDVVVVGQGYVGLPLAVRAAETGYRVVGYDTDERRVKLLENGESFSPDVSSSRLRSVLDSGAYQPSADTRFPAWFDVCIITVPTPLRKGQPDLSYVTAAARTVAPQLVYGSTVILESTTYPGTTEDLLRPILEQGSGLRTPGDFLLGYSPERIDPGNQRWSFENTPKLVAGNDAASLARVADFYASLGIPTVPVSTTRTAELAKLLENTFRHVNIAVMNELVQRGGLLGCDIWEAIDAAATKPFGYLPFTPGPGVGGHCLPIDPSYLSWQVAQTSGTPLQFVELANDVNAGMPDYIVRRLATGLGRDLCGARLLLLGLAYKKNTADLRESPALVIARRLTACGAAVRVCDPVVPTTDIPIDLQLVQLSAAEVAAADAVAVLTDHDCFDYGLIAGAKYVFDSRNRCRGPNVERL